MSPETPEAELRITWLSSGDDEAVVAILDAHFDRLMDELLAAGVADPMVSATLNRVSVGWPGGGRDG